MVLAEYFGSRRSRCSTLRWPDCEDAAHQFSMILNELRLRVRAATRICRPDDRQPTRLGTSPLGGSRHDAASRLDRQR